MLFLVILLVGLFYLGAILILVFGFWSLIGKKTIVKGRGGIKETRGIAAIIPGLLYIYVGLGFLLLMLTFTYELIICPKLNKSEGECSDNIFDKSLNIWLIPISPFSFLEK